MTGQPGHDYFRLLAAAGIDGELTQSEAAELRAHLAACTSCRADEQAMRRDNVWLATAEAVERPWLSVRATVLRAAQGPVPGRRLAWGPVATMAILAVAIGGWWIANGRPSTEPGAIGSPRPSQVTTSAASPSAEATASPSALAPGLWSIPPNSRFARVEAHLVGNSTGAAPEIVVTAVVIGGNAGAPQGFVDVVNPTGESWRGSITRASYGYVADGTVYVARIEGCIRGGVAPCDLYALQFVDGRERSDDQDEISLSFITSERPEPEPWEFWYLRVSGDIVVDGPIARPEPTPSTSPSE